MLKIGTCNQAWELTCPVSGIMFSTEVRSTSGVWRCLQWPNFLLSFCKVFGDDGPQNARKVRPYLRLTWGQLKNIREKICMSQIGVILSKQLFRTMYCYLEPAHTYQPPLPPLRCITLRVHLDQMMYWVEFDISYKGNFILKSVCGWWPTKN